MNTFPNITSDKEAFIYISNHLINQNDKSIDYFETCMYRGYTQKQKEEARRYAEQNYNMEFDGDYEDEMAYGDELAMEYFHELPQDAKCAVGAIISDEFYSHQLEEKNFIDNDDVIKAVVNSNKDWNMTNSSYSLLTILQSIHDSSNVSDWSIILNPDNFKFDSEGNFSKILIESKYMTVNMQSLEAVEKIK